MGKFIFLIFVSFSLIGCVGLSKEYTPKEKPTTYKGEKYSVSYSVDYCGSGYKLFGRALEDEWKKKIQDKLKSSGGFDSVAYRSINNKGPYHIEFKIYSVNPNDDEVMGALLVSLLSCATVPCWVNLYLDVNTVVYLDDKPIYSICAAEKIVRTMWMPLAPAGLVWNDYISWDYIENKSLTYVINNILEHQKTLGE